MSMVEPPRAKAFIFDVEGTLIDCVPQTIESWRETLAGFAISLSCEELHRYSGMDGGEMLKRLLPDVPESRRKAILDVQGKLYRKAFLPLVHPLPFVPELLCTLHTQGALIGIASNARADELQHYAQMLDVSHMVDATVSGDDVHEGKPQPELFHLALHRLNASPASTVAVGDTPFDAAAATAAGMRSIGLLSGGFDLPELERAGFGSVYRDPEDLLGAIAAKR